MARDNKVTLVSSEGVSFDVDKLVAFKSHTVKSLIEDTNNDTTIPLPNVSTETLVKIIEYCEYRVESQKSSAEKPAIHENQIKQWDAEFVKVDLNMLINLILAGSFMNINSLLTLTCQTFADMIKGKTTEEFRRQFSIPNFIPEEEGETSMMYCWTVE